MTHATLNEAEREHLLKMAGVPGHQATALADTPGLVIAEQPDASDLVYDAAGDAGTDVDSLVQVILAKAHGDRGVALRLCEELARQEFDRIKLSKVQAAAAGLDAAGKTAHNRNAWAHCQKLAERLKTAVRRDFREHGGFVAAKIRSRTPGPLGERPEVQAFLEAHGAVVAVQELAKLVGLR